MNQHPYGSTSADGSRPAKEIKEEVQGMRGENAGLFDDRSRMLVDPIVLFKLRAELDDDEGWLLFLKHFLNQLPMRIDKLRSGLVGANVAVVIDAVLSLKISSQMVGAERLAGMAVYLQRSVEDAVHRGDAAAVLPVLANLHLAAIAVCGEQSAASLAGEVEEAERSYPAGAG